MKIKRYFAADMRQALRLVRDEQGPDAVILSNRKVNGGVEIVVAVDYDEGAVARLAAQERASEEGGAMRPFATVLSAAVANTTARPAAQHEQSEAGKVVWSQDPAIAAMREELMMLRSMMQSQLSTLAWSELERQQPQQAAVVKRLTRMGLSREVARRIAAQVNYTEDAERNYRLALTHLAQALPVTGDDILTHGGVVALVGPTGVGKTTTVAKLAARYTLRHGPNRVALITTDSYRIGALQQLRTFGQILGAPVYIVNDADELAQLLDSLRDKSLVLIDTAGMSQRDLRLNEQLQLLTNAKRSIRNYVVLSATSQRAALDDVTRAFHSIPLDGAIVTKVDEAASCGEVLSVVVQHHLPIAYVGDGQRVPEDLQPARSQTLVIQAANLARQQAERYAADSAHLAQQTGTTGLMHG